MSHEERIIHLLEENLIVMSALTDATTALTSAVADLATAVASVPSSGSDSAQVIALQAEVASLQADADAATTAVTDATTAVTEATATLTSDEAPPTPPTDTPPTDTPPAPVPDILTFPTQAIDVAEGGTINSTVEADGGTPPYSFSSSSLPEGLAINGDGVITGPAPATSPVTGTVDVTDAGGQSASGSVEITVTAAS